MPITIASAAPIRQPFPDAARSLTSLLAPLERTALVWLARRMPRRVNSDHLTAVALVAMLLAGASYWLASVTRVGLLLAVVCLAINWFGDSLDGTLARVRQQQRPRYGFYVDHVVDTFGGLLLLGGLALSGYMSALLALGLLVSYLMLSVEAFLATQALGTFKMSYFGVGPTELRILLAVGNLALWLHPTANLWGHRYRLFDVGGAVGIAGLLFTLLFAAARNTRTLYRAEPIPHTPARQWR
ncbi:MAG TPA: CDP-alcohol phosphatidyltransferase family protein [Vicinamibacterales bacterium]|jgi:phosphatidylglycerophosphate synthase|nr:CDP-alcohol phosphatidyltransferase family protein [Vicinamibacterales bacterium]